MYRHTTVAVSHETKERMDEAIACINNQSCIHGVTIHSMDELINYGLICIVKEGVMAQMEAERLAVERAKAQAQKAGLVLAE